VKASDVTATPYRNFTTKIHENCQDFNVLSSLINRRNINFYKFKLMMKNICKLDRLVRFFSSKKNASFEPSPFLQRLGELSIEGIVCKSDEIFG
jgi:hypothetical protein